MAAAVAECCRREPHTTGGLAAVAVVLGAAAALGLELSPVLAGLGSP